MNQIKNREWYLSLNKSKLTPPGYVFGIVWPILYLLLGISFLLTIKSPKCIGFCSPLVFFTIQMILNLIWTTVFFRVKMMKTALILIYSIIALTIVAFTRMLPVNSTAALLLIPYLLWLCFASYLNLYIVVKN
jgi:tryptophan-rich sensory protein